MGIDKKFCYDTIEKMHLLKPKFTGDMNTDIALYCKTYNLQPNRGAPDYFRTMFGLMNDLHVYEIDDDADRMIQNTLIPTLPAGVPELFKHSFLVTTAGDVMGYNCFVYTTSNNRYILEIGSSDTSLCCMSIHGIISDITQPTTFIQNVIDDGTPPPEDPNAIRYDVLKYLYTFSILLQAEKTPIEVTGHPRTIKNHYAKKAGVSKTVWETNYVFLNASVKRFYDEHTPYDKTDKSAVPRITRAHIRNVIGQDGREKQIFIPSYISTKWVKEGLKKTKATVF